MNETIKEKLMHITHEPGCYLMKDSADEVIYVGKAKDLYKRIRSYFYGTHDAKTTKLVTNINDFEYIITSTEIEAFILEINLIKKHQPKYNILLTDDKSYPYIHLTNEQHPRLIYVRDINKKTGKYYGPYPNSAAASFVVDRLNKIFPFRKCKKLPKKECLYYHLGSCLAPCIKEVSPEVYLKMQKEVDSLLRGNAKEEIKKMQLLMLEAAKNLEFEKALEYRNLISDLEIVREKQKMEGYNFEADVFGYYLINKKLSIQIFHLREGKIIERKGLLFDIENEADFFSEFVVRFYLEQNNPLPQVIMLAAANQQLIEEALNHSVLIPQKGKNLDLVNLVCNNAKNKLDVLLKLEEKKYDQNEGALENLKKILNLVELNTIEVFDNSNISGASPVSAMIVYKNGQLQKSLYRKFTIKTVIGANDVATMYEVIKRRYTLITNKPDLIIVDGGKGQVNAARKALQEVNRDIPVVGLIKNDFHKTEALYYQDTVYTLKKDANEFYLLEKLQNEVHRYAITFFRKTHTKNLIASQLDDIKGIGKVKKTQILQIVGEKDFLEKLDKLKLNEEQKQRLKALFTE